MAIYLRQICLVAGQLQPAIDDLSAVFCLPRCYTDPEVGKFGLENALLALGSQFIEVVAPTRDGTAAGRFLDRRGGDGGYMVICQVPTLAEQAAVRKRASEEQVRVAYESDHKTWNIMQLHPADMGAAFFEIDWDEQADTSGNWHPAGGLTWKTFNTCELVSAITAVELQNDDPVALARRWSNVAGVPVIEKNGKPIVELANACLRFVMAEDGRGTGLGGLDLKVADKARVIRQAQSRDINVIKNQINICGVRFNLVN